MLEKLLERIAIALESLAVTMKQAAINGSATAASPGKPAAAAQAVEDDLGLGPEPVVAEVLDTDKVLVIARDIAKTKTRDVIKAGLAHVKGDSVKELKPEQWAPFVKFLRDAPTPPAV